MRSFIYASTALNVVTERQGRAGVAGMNLLRNEDPARPRFAGEPAAEQPRCRLDIASHGLREAHRLRGSQCLRAARLSSCRATRHGEHKHQAMWFPVHSGGTRCSATSA